jgi:hypothetical protein
VHVYAKADVHFEAVTRTSVIFLLGVEGVLARGCGSQLEGSALLLHADGAV